MTGNAWKYSNDLDIVDLEFMQKKFITYKEGCEYYGFGEKPMVRLAHEASAVYKIEKMVRINREMLNCYKGRNTQLLVSEDIHIIEDVLSIRFAR